MAFWLAYFKKECKFDGIIALFSTLKALLKLIIYTFMGNILTRIDVLCT